MRTCLSTAHAGSLLGTGTPAAVRLENVGRFMDFVGESIARAAEQVREILSTKPAPTAGGSEPGRPDS